MSELLDDEQWSNKVHTAMFDCERYTRECMSGSGNIRELIEDARIARSRLADVERERERLRDCLSNVQEWLSDRASRLGAVGLYPDDLAAEVEAALAEPTARAEQA